MASASDPPAHPALQPADQLILPPQPPPPAVETSIGPPHCPPEAPSQTRSFNRACAPARATQTLIRLGSALVSARKRLIAACRSMIERNTPRLSRRRVSLEKKPSTAFGACAPRSPRTASAGGGRASIHRSGLGR